LSAVDGQHLMNQNARLPGAGFFPSLRLHFVNIFRINLR